jgi:hypothetical protein
VTTVATWAGTARYVETLFVESSHDYKTTFEGDVSWQKDTNPDPSLPAGWVSYRISGRIHVVYAGTRNFVGQICTDEAAMDVDPAQPDPGLTPSYLYLRPDGTYAGAVYKTAPLTITRRCASGSVSSFGGDVRMGLSFEGTVTSGRRMQGEMVPHSVAGQAETGSWDFAAR